jgi:hypothetical protein
MAGAAGAQEMRRDFDSLNSAGRAAFLNLPPQQRRVTDCAKSCLHADYASARSVTRNQSIAAI